MPPEVPSPYSDDYREAVGVLPISPKASAALSSRLLQHVIHDKAGIKKRNPSEEIDALVASNQLPTDLAEDLDALRNIGNFAAHPIKSEHSGEVVDVEDGEAEWSLDLLEEMLHHYFVAPAVRQKKRDRLNEKLPGTGQPELKGT